MSSPQAAEQIAVVRLLRELVKGDANTLGRALANPTNDLQTFIQFAARHKLGAFTYWAARQHCGMDPLPARVVTAAKAAALMERSRNRRLIVMLEDLATVLERAKINVLFIKGPLFAHRFYEDVDARGVADLDILVRTPGDLDRVEAVLLGQGFTRAFRLLGGRRITRWFSHHFTYARDSLSLDVHWVLQRHPALHVDYPRLWATSAQVPFGSRTYTAASSEYELVLQLLGVVADLQVGKLVVRSIVDIHRIVQTIEPTVDWNEFFAIRARERILRPSLWVMALVLNVLDCHERFPGLSNALAIRAREVALPNDAHQMIFDSRPLAVRQKLLALRLYEMPLALGVAWWLLSLPFRVAVYASEQRSNEGAA